MHHCKRFCAFFLTLCLLTLTGCTVRGEAVSGGASGSLSGSVMPEPDSAASMTLIGIALAGSAEDGDSLSGQADELQAALQEAGFAVEAAYAGGDGDTQSRQLSAMIEDECAILIVEAVEAAAIDDALTAAGQAGIAVLSCGAALDNSAVTCSVGTDYAAMGAAQAAYLVEALGLDGDGGNACTLELVVEDSAAGAQIYEGAMAVLEPYLTAGQLTIPSGQQSYEEVSTSDGADRMTALLSGWYADGEPLDALLTTGNDICDAAMTTLLSAYRGSVYPVVVGTQCALESVQWLSDGYLAMTTLTPEVSYPASLLAQIRQIRRGETPEDSLATGETVTGENLTALLVDTGLYTVSISGQVTEGNGEPEEADAEDVSAVEYEPEDELSGESGDGDGS